MAITVKHKFVSAIPDGDDTTIVRPSNWNDDHQLTGTVPVANGGTGAATLTGYVKGNGTAAMTASTTVPSSDITGLGTMSTQNANNVAVTGGTVSGTTLTSDTVSNNLTFTSTSAPSYVEGELWYDSTQKALTYYNDVTNNQVHIGQEVQLKVINNTGSSIANGTPVYVTGTSSGQTYPNIALAQANAASTSAVLGLTNGTIASGAVGYVCTAGLLTPCNTGSFSVGQVLYLSPYSAGQLMNTVPPTGYAVQVGVVAYANTPNGSIYVKQTTPLAVSASTIVGQVAVANGGTGASTLTGYVKGSGTSALTASSTIPNTDISGLGTMSTQNANAVAVTGGTIDNTVIGGTTPAAGTFTTITGQTEVLKGTGENLTQYSEQIDNAYWVKSNVTVSADATTSPIGTTTADLVYPTTTGTSRVFYRASLLTTGLPYTMSIYAKAGGLNFMYLATEAGTGPGVVWFNLSTGSVGTTTAGYTASIQSVGSGWYRCSVNRTASANYLIWGVSDADNTITATTSGTNGVYFWGAQLELSSTVGTYVATTTTAVYGTPTLSFSGVAGLGLQSDGSLYVSPAGTGALQAQATTSSATGGNARGANAVDWQTARSAATNVASGQYGVIGGGYGNISSAYASTTSGGNGNTASGFGGATLGGIQNTASGFWSTAVGGNVNTAAGYLNFIGGGFGNTGTANGTVTTQSGTMNGTTAVTLSGSNASIKVGQYIAGTSIANGTYVAAISGTSLTLSQAASGSSTSTLSFYTPHGVVVGGGNNQATGSYSFIGGGGDAGTSSNRNTASGDWSFVGGGIKNTASGIGSVVSGGGAFPGAVFPNTASGIASVVAGGISNTANNQGSVVSGGYANSASGVYSTVVGGSTGTTRSISGNVCFPAQQSIFNSLGTTQAALLILGVQTTNATATTLLSDSSGSASGINQVILPDNSAYYFKVSVIAGVTGGGNTKAWTLEGAIKRGSGVGTAAIVGTVTTTVVAADVGAATWAVTATADTTNGGLKITVTGQASTTIRWVAQATTTEMTF